MMHHVIKIFFLGRNFFGQIYQQDLIFTSFLTDRLIEGVKKIFKLLIFTELVALMPSEMILSGFSFNRLAMVINTGTIFLALHRSINAWRLISNCRVISS